jgi:lysophospholipase L1-like esterase
MWIGSEMSSVRRGLRAFLCACLAWLAGCGGGTNQIEPFVPRQVILLGDESTTLTADGKRYAINGLNTSNAIDCASLPIWTQLVVASFGMILDRCNPNNLTARGITRGAPGAKAADLEAQITAQLTASTPTSKDLFLVMIGLNDIIERYEAGAGCGDPELRARGQLVAAQVNRLVAADARIIVVTVPDMGLSPYARTREASNPGQSARLTCLTADFNARVRVDIVQDGRFIGLVLADDLTQAMTRAPGNFSLTNVTDAACTVAAPDCTTATLVSGASTGTHLWADDRHLGPVANNTLASFAETRARNNPF